MLLWGLGVAQGGRGGGGRGVPPPPLPPPSPLVETALNLVLIQRPLPAVKLRVFYLQTASNDSHLNRETSPGVEHGGAGGGGLPLCASSAPLPFVYPRLALPTLIPHALCSLALTALLTVIVVYLFIVVGYVFFQDDFVGSEGSEGVCSSLQQCFAFGLLNGLRAGGGLGDLLPTRQGLRALFDFAFFLVIVVIILNIVFGIIIDTFAELRDEKQFIEKDNKKSCLICGQSANFFDRYVPGGFSAHVKNTHNMWQYLYFLVYLDQKSIDEYTGQVTPPHYPSDWDTQGGGGGGGFCDLPHFSAIACCLSPSRACWCLWYGTSIFAQFSPISPQFRQNFSQLDLTLPDRSPPPSGR